MLSVPFHLQQFVAVGTTANEAFHNELNKLARIGHAAYRGKRQLTVQALCMKKLVVHCNAFHRKVLHHVCQEETAARLLPVYTVWCARAWQEACANAAAGRPQQHGPQLQLLSATREHRRLVRDHKARTCAARPVFLQQKTQFRLWRFKRTPFTKLVSRRSPAYLYFTGYAC